jgi:parallel beta-helix repeat protein
MRPSKILFVLIFCLFLKVSLAEVTVGNCRSDKHSYSTISAAVAAAPAGDVVNVCPGTYAEQLEIDKPLTIRGIMGMPSIIMPSEGLNQLPAESGAYPQVFVNNAGGQVKLTNILVDGSDALINFEGLVFGLDALCPTGAIQNFVGVYFLNTSGVLDSVNVSNQFASFFLPEDEGPQVIPNCGSGVEFSGSGKAVVRNSTIANVGFYAIYTNGDLTAEHNVISGGFGPHGAGITSISGTIANNTVTGSIDYYKTVGIQGGDTVRNNVVQSAIYGIMGAGSVRNNTLTNNAVSVSGGSDIAENAISAPPTYYDPGCFNEGCDGTVTGPAFPTIGVDLGCGSAIPVRNNKIEGVGIGFANLESGERIARTNLLSNVTTLSTSCGGAAVGVGRPLTP